MKIKNQFLVNIKIIPSPLWSDRHPSTKRCVHCSKSERTRKDVLSADCTTLTLQTKHRVLLETSINEYQSLLNVYSSKKKTNQAKDKYAR